MPKGSDIISFYGSDGCGKSSIARAYHERASSNGYAVEVIGGSSYKDWLTPSIARNALGPNHHINSSPKTETDKVKLYEEIAVACYEYAGYLSEKGTTVLIDSDPVLKRVIWSRLSSPELYNEDYEIKFGKYVLSLVDAERSFPSTIVGVNMRGEVGAKTLLRRIDRRGGVSCYDPASLGEMELLECVVNDVWNDLVADGGHDRRPSVLRDGFADTQVLYADSVDCSPEELDDYLSCIAEGVERQVVSSVR